MTEHKLNEIARGVICSASQTREGVDVIFQCVGFELSPCWRMAGWRMQFVHLPAGDSLTLDTALGRYFAKVVTGRLVTPDLNPFAARFSVRSTLVEGAVIVADQDTLMAVFQETVEVPENVTNVTDLAITGVHADACQWRSFETRFGGAIPAFNGVDAHMCGGFHLLNPELTEICYVNLWCAGQGVNLTTHNHAHPPHPQAPAFAEVHWVFNNGTGEGGMYCADSADGDKTATFPLTRGEEHGYFFAVDEAGHPQQLSNGAVEYPWHGWESGVKDGS